MIWLLFYVLYGIAIISQCAVISFYIILTVLLLPIGLPHDDRCFVLGSHCVRYCLLLFGCR